MIRQFFCYYMLCTIGLLSMGQSRTWTDVQGKTIEAKMVSKSADAVTVFFKGKEVTIPLKRLSQKDRDFVAVWDSSTSEQNKKTTKGASDTEEYFALPWPKVAAVDYTKIAIEERKGSKGEYIYTSPHYEFISNTKLSKVVVKRFAALFEATRLYVQKLPYASLKAYKTEKKHQVFLFDTLSSYREAGGPPNSAGVYLGGKDIILVPCKSLGLEKRGSSWAMDYGKSNKTLPHEIVHQLMDWCYYEPGARGWFSEGIAEYVAATPYRTGRFSANRVEAAVKEYVTTYSRKEQDGRALGIELHAPHLKEYMMMPYAEFTERKKGNFNYGFGALLVTYFNHYDGDKDGANIKDFLRALREGKKGLEALEVLRAGRTFEELEKDISKAWRRKGVKITFGK